MNKQYKNEISVASVLLKMTKSQQ